MRAATTTVLAVFGLAAVVWATAPADLGRANGELPAVASSGAPGLLAVDLRDGATLEDLAAIEQILGADLYWTHPLSIDEALAQGHVPDLAAAVALLENHPNVEVAEPVIEQTMLGYPNDPLYEKQWHLREMGAPEGWANTPRGRGVTVAVIDTGVTVVEDLDAARVLKGASFVPGTSSAADDQGHGTHVAGTIAQSTNNGIGAAGVAPEAMILPVKVLSASGSGQSTWIAAGIDYAVDEGADVINLSLGGSYSRVIHTAIQKARAQGVVVVAAAGNSGRQGVSWPGALAETIGVSAVGPGGEPAPYTSWGKGVDLAAPGGDKRKPGGGVLQNTIAPGGSAYLEYQGTSMATPHVAGAAAVLLSTGTCDADCVERSIVGSGGLARWDDHLGWGRLDLQTALGTVHQRFDAVRMLFALLATLMLARLAKAGGGFTTKATVTGVLAASGVFFLPWLGLSGVWVDTLSRPFLSWPTVAFGPGAEGSPLWLSVLVPALVAFTAGASRSLRPLALGFAAGVGAHLIHGSFSGTLSPWWLGENVGTWWLSFHGTLALAIALGLAGVEKLEREGASK